MLKAPLNKRSTSVGTKSWGENKEVRLESARGCVFFKALSVDRERPLLTGQYLANSVENMRRVERVHLVAHPYGYDCRTHDRFLRLGVDDSAAVWAVVALEVDVPTLGPGADEQTAQGYSRHGRQQSTPHREPPGRDGLSCWRRRRSSSSSITRYDRGSDPAAVLKRSDRTCITKALKASVRSSSPRTGRRRIGCAATSSWRAGKPAGYAGSVGMAEYPGL